LLSVIACFLRRARYRSALPQEIYKERRFAVNDYQLQAEILGFGENRSRLKTLVAGLTGGKLICYPDAKIGGGICG
jgi:hypothetical protein